MDWQAARLTLQLASATTLLLLVLAIPLAWWIARARGILRTLVQAAVALPLVLPPTVIGFYLLVGLGPLHWPGRLIARLLGHPLAFSFAGLLVGSALYSLPFAVQPLVAGFASQAREFSDAAAGIGMSPAATFLTIILPMARGSLATAAVLVFSHTVGEFGVVLLLGGNIPGLTRTLSIALYDQVSDFNYAAANRTAALLVLIAALRQWLGARTPILSVTHDIAEAYLLQAEIIRFARGRVTAQGPANVILAEERSRLLATLTL